MKNDKNSLSINNIKPIIDNLNTNYCFLEKINNILYNNFKLIFFGLNQTIITKLKKGYKYSFETDGLNGCTASVIIINNNNGEQFVISTHFPPIDFMRKKQLDKLEKYLSLNFGKILNIHTFSVTETSRDINDYKIINKLIEKITFIKPVIIVSKYNKKEYYRVSKKKLGKMSLEINKSYILYSHEGKIYQKKLKI